ncbi:MAG TPA: GAF domain-containing protein [Ktedonobacterales bacterium]
MGDDSTPMNPSPAPESTSHDTQTHGKGRKARARKSDADGVPSRGRASRDKGAGRASAQPDTPSPALPGAEGQASGASQRTTTYRPIPRARRSGLRSRGREPGVVRLAERSRMITEHTGVHLLTDPLAALLPAARTVLFNAALDDAIHAVAEELASTLAPAIVQVWIADAAAWSSGHERVGGLELEPSLRLRAASRSAVRGTTESGLAAIRMETNTSGERPPETSVSGVMPRWPGHPDPLLDAVAASRHPVVYYNAQEHEHARAWLPLMPKPYCALPGAELPPPTLGTLAAYPLKARGQFLGVLAVAASAHLSSRQLAALEEISELIAQSADRDRLLSYSRSQEALAQTVVRYAPVAMAVLTGRDHHVALANPTFALLLGLDAGMTLTGRKLRDLVPDNADTLSAGLGLDAVYTSGESQAMIELPIALGGDITYWNVTTSPLPGVSARSAGVLLAAVDVTRQVIARQRAVDSAEEAQVRIGQMMTLHATSLAVSSQFGSDPRELLADILRRSVLLLNGRAGTVYVRDARRNELEVIVCQGLRGDYTGQRIRIGEGIAGQVARTGQGMIVDDYRVYPYRASIYGDEDFRAVIAVPLIAHGQVVGVLDVLDDAERRAFTDDDLWLLDLFAAQASQTIENARTYVELEHAFRKQRDLDRMKDDFIATASHELRTPLTGVQGFLDLLLDYPGSRDDLIALDFLRKAATSAEELAALTERLLQTARLDSGRLEVHTNPVRLATVVDEVLRFFREVKQAQGGGHELLAEIPSHVYVQADLGRLKEVLDNLIANAIKYSPQGGRVLVRCVPARFETNLTEPPPDAIEERPTMVLPFTSHDPAARVDDPNDDPTAPAPSVVAATAQRPYYVITVSDEGMGIPASERSHLFGRFARLESAKISQIRGTGLGLYICRQIVRAMGGDVWLQASVPGHGSVFAFALPEGAIPPTDTAPLPAVSGQSAQS